MPGSPANFPASRNPRQMATAHAQTVECVSSKSEAFGKFDHSCWHVRCTAGPARRTRRTVCGLGRSLGGRHGAALPARLSLVRPGALMRNGALPSSVCCIQHRLLHFDTKISPSPPGVISIIFLKIKFLAFVTLPSRRLGLSVKTGNRKLWW